MKTKRWPFNMVEIVIAMVIILVALVGVLGLLPSSIEANADAVNRSAAADAADQFLHYMAARIEKDWADTAALPDTKPTAESSTMLFSTAGFMKSSALEVSFESPSETAEFDPAVHNSGIFRVKQKSTASISDFEGEVRAWKSTNEYGKDFVTPGTTVVRGTPPAANIPGAPAEHYGGVLWSGNLLEVNGNSLYMPEGGHTQADLKIIGPKCEFGVFTYCNSAHAKDVETKKVIPQPVPQMPRSMEDYKQIAKDAGTYFTEDVELENGADGTIYLKKQGKTIPNGSVVFVDGANIVAKEKGLNIKATMICTGDEIHINCNDLTIQPAMDNVLAWCVGDIHIGGNAINVGGIVRCNDELHFNGNDGSVFNGSLWGDDLVKINGNDLSVTGDGGGSISCEPNLIAEFGGDHRSVTANSSMSIDSVTLKFCDDTTQLFGGLSGQSVSLWGTDANDMKRIKSVQITSGCNGGVWVGNDALDCSTPNYLGDPGDPFRSRSIVCTINAEVSWPVELPYARRNKVVYKREVAKNAEVIPR